MMQHVSMLMTGERARVISLPESVVLINLFIITQPAMIKRVYGDKSPDERDKIRADIIRKALNTVKI
jgi:protein-arginine kinase